MSSTPSSTLLQARQQLSAALGHHQSGRLEMARALYESALRLAPDLGQAHHYLGILELQSGQLTAGRQHLEQALALLPAEPGLLSALGNACLMDQAPDEALRHYDRALSLQPGHADTLSNRAQALLALERPQDALASAQASLAREPGVLATLNLQAHALRDLARYDEAIRDYRAVLAHADTAQDSWTGLGICLARLGRHDEAIVALRRAVALGPDDARAHQNLGLELHETLQLDAARQALEKAASLDPTDASAPAHLAITLMALGRTAEALTLQRRAIDMAPERADLLSHHLFTLNCEEPQSGATPSEITALARRYGRLLDRSSPETVPPDIMAQRGHARRPLKVALVSGDFNDHPVAHFLAPLLPHIDPAQVELHAVATRHVRDGITDRLKAHVRHWHVIEGRNDEDAAATLRDLGIDILVDLSGHTAHHRLGLFARRVAPLQLSWLGYLATTGVSAMDHVLVDAVALPPELDEQFTERPWRVDGPLNCLTRPDLAGPSALALPLDPLPALSRGHLRFGCFQTLPKLSDASLQTWARLLQAMPEASLHLQNRQLDQDAARQGLMARLQAHGVAPDRVTWGGAVASRADYLRAVGQVDIMLDTWPYNGITTTCEALWMGVPVLTLAGRSLLSRQGVSLLTAAGLPDWIAPDEAQLIELARHHGGDLSRLAQTRRQLRAQVEASPLFAPADVARRWQQALLDMWTAGGRGLTPRGNC